MKADELAEDQMWLTFEREAAQAEVNRFRTRALVTDRQLLPKWRGCESGNVGNSCSFSRLAGTRWPRQVLTASRSMPNLPGREPAGVGAMRTAAKHGRQTSPSESEEDNEEDKDDECLGEAAAKKSKK